MRLSVVIPTLNEAAFLAPTLESVRATCPDAEVICVDGGSADETVAIARRAGARMIPSERGRG
ncbi:MAG: glycosyltransferase [Opitutaceae bacterium]